MANTERRNSMEGGSPGKAEEHSSKTVTETIIGEHEHVIVGYSLLKGIGDGEPIASDRFVVGGHEWVLLFYPDGKKSSTEASGNHHAPHPMFGPNAHFAPIAMRRGRAAEVNYEVGGPNEVREAVDRALGTQRNEEPHTPAAAGGAGAGPNDAGGPPAPVGAPGPTTGPPQGTPGTGGSVGHGTPGSAGGLGTPGTGNAAGPHRRVRSAGREHPDGTPNTVHTIQRGITPPHIAHHHHHHHHHHHGHVAGGFPAAGAETAVAPRHHAHGGIQHVAVRSRDREVEYAALFVALIGETGKPMGVVHTTEGQIVRAFHHFTLVDQMGRGRDVTKGRRREQGAVKISCARQDPNARNCHGYRKFIKRQQLESPDLGYLMNDTIIIRYKIELVVMSGGAFCRADQEQNSLPLVEIPPPMLGAHMGDILKTGEGSDVTIVVEDEEMQAHRLVLASRSPVFKALLDSPMREGKEGKIRIHDVRAPAFQILLHFVYTDSLPEELDGENLEVTMAQHLLAAADRFELPRLRAICEKHLCETVDIANAATTLTLAEENHASELRRHCLNFVAGNLSAVMATSGFEYMIQRCPNLQRTILEACSKDGGEGAGKGTKREWEDGRPGTSSKDRRVRFRLK